VHARARPDARRGATVALMAASSVDVRVTATCRDCGSEVPTERWDTVRWRVEPDPVDQTVVRILAPGACRRCGGGRVDVRGRLAE
jgi:hypothetical protein